MRILIKIIVSFECFIMLPYVILKNESGSGVRRAPCMKIKLLKCASTQYKPAVSLFPFEQEKMGKGKVEKISSYAEKTGGALERGREGGIRGGETAMKNSAVCTERK